VSIDIYLDAVHAKLEDIQKQRGIITPLRENRGRTPQHATYVPEIEINDNVRLVSRMHSFVQGEFLGLYDLQHYRKENLELKLVPKTVSALGKLVTYKGEIDDAFHAIES